MGSIMLEGRDRWQELMRSWAVDPVMADRAFNEACRCYAGPGRFYHSLDHVMNVLATVDGLGPYAKHLQAVKLAAWLHDVVYDSRAADNEDRSAEYAERLCDEFSIPTGGLASSLILTTKSHDAGGDDDAKVLIDADLAILGADETVYRAYAENIRREYAWVPESEYRTGRQHVLETFLARPTIFHLLRHLEEPARRNIAAEIVRLAH
jgi:predicted metal-dependent HD superfamily phosphohydrolase